MVQSIFATLDAQEERQVCECMTSKKFNATQCESFMQLTGISKESPYYSPPSSRRGIFQYLIQHAFQLPSRLGSLPALPAAMPVVAPSTLSERQVVSDGSDPLSCDIEETPISTPEIVGEMSELTPNDQVTPTPITAVSNYRLVVIKLFSWTTTKRRQQDKTVIEEQTPEATAAPAPAEPSTVETKSTPPPTEARSPRMVNFGTPTGFVTAGRRAYLFGAEKDETLSPSLEEGTELLPILTPLQRAIAQARAHGYHLHQPQPLSYQGPSSTSSNPCRHSPPGLAHMKHKYCLRSHQVAAGDYFRKEAAHRAAVAARNYNISRGKLIPKEERSLHEPTGMIIPDYEITRLRVVYAPRKFPIRLWKTQHRGPEDWIEVEDRSCTGGLGLLKCNSHLRKEILPEEPVEDIPIFIPVPEETAEEMEAVNVAIALEEEEEEQDQEEQSDLKTPLVLAIEEPSTISMPMEESSQVLDASMIQRPSTPSPVASSSSPEVMGNKATDSQTSQRASAREKFLQWKRIARSLSQTRGTPTELEDEEGVLVEPLSPNSSRQQQQQEKHHAQRPPRPKPRFRNDGRHNNNNTISDKKAKSKSIAATQQRRRSIGDHSVPKLTPVQRMRAAANRITTNTNAGRTGRKESTKDKRRGSSKKQTVNEQLPLPGCLDPNVAESHRRLLLERYYNPQATNGIASSSRASLDTTITHIENTTNEDTLSEASDETLTNDTASVDTAHDVEEGPTSLLNDKTLSVEGPSAGKQALQAVKNYAKNIGF